MFFKIAAMQSLFSFSLFFVVFRETLEVGIILSVLLAFIDKLPTLDPAARTKLKRMVWIGTLSSILIVFAIGACVIFVWYTYGTNVFESSELLFEGVFGLIASVFVFVTALAFLCGDQLHAKMSRKLHQQFNTNIQSNSTPHNSTADLIESSENYILQSPKAQDSNGPSPVSSSVAFFWVPFLTVIREGVETVLLIAGVSFGEAPSSIPLAAVAGIGLGSLVGIAIHRASGQLSLRWFFGAASYLLLLMAAGIFSRSVGRLEDNTWIKLTGGNDDSTDLPFDPRQNVWYLSCCNENTVPFFGVLFSVFGYRSVATYGTITSYCLFWMVAIMSIVLLKYRLRSKQAGKVQV